MELLTLTTPQVTTINTTDYHVDHIGMSRSAQRLVVIFIGSNGERIQMLKEGAVAVTLMTALNKASLTVKSLERRCIEQAIADGLLVGAVSGVPD